MATATELLRQGKKDEIWRKYCGFLDLTVKEFLEIQRRYLMEQLGRLEQCELGRKIVGPRAPKTLAEFRETVPFTTYEDYAEYLAEQREDVLPARPFIWAHTSGRSSEYQYKWFPYTSEMYRRGGEAGLACFILSAGSGRGHVNLREKDISLYSLAPPPYVSGLLLEASASEFDFNIIPSPDEAGDMNFQERIQQGFRLAMQEGLDFFYGITSILLRVSDQFSAANRGSRDRSSPKLPPKALWRMAKAVIKSKLRGRGLLPKDVWKVKGVLCGGTDTSIFKDKVTQSWGRPPLEVYASTEFGIIATQVWTYDGLTFFPYNTFLEFIPEEDYYRMVRDPEFKPRALLLDELEPEREYVLAGTNFHGGALVRCIIGDMIRITALEDEKAGIRLPQMVFSTRIDDVIDIGGFTRLTEKTIWQAIENADVRYVEWTIRKEYREERPVLHLYIELKTQDVDSGQVEQRVHGCLKELNEPYQALESMAGLKPLTVTLLSRGTFRRYYEERQAAGADLAHLKPAHINPPDTVTSHLLRMSSWRI